MGYCFLQYLIIIRLLNEKEESHNKITRVYPVNVAEKIMFYKVNGTLKGMDCLYCLSQNENGQIDVAVRRNDENETLLLDFSRKLHTAECSILPEGILIMEDNSYANDVYADLLKADIVKSWVKKLDFNGVAVLVTGLSEQFNMFREGCKTNYYASSAYACA